LLLIAKCTIVRNLEEALNSPSEPISYTISVCEYPEKSGNRFCRNIAPKPYPLLAFRGVFHLVMMARMNWMGVGHGEYDWLPPTVGQVVYELKASSRARVGYRWVKVSNE
jgi:hypothetical protein